MVHDERATFQELAALEPNLDALLREALAHHGNTADRFCANVVFYGYDDPARGLKQRLARLVGSARKSGPPELRSWKAFDTARDAIYQALPDCRGRCRCQAALDVCLNG